MKKRLGIAFVCVAPFLLLFAYLLIFPRSVPVRDTEVEPSIQRLARGKYLARHVTRCMSCHSERDFHFFSGPVIEETLGKGGREIYDNHFPTPVYAKNVTPANIGDWSDGELIRALTSGLTASGKTIIPAMPWEDFAKMSEPDILAIVAYLRTLHPIETKEPPVTVGVTERFFLRLRPSKAELPTKTLESSNPDYPDYITNIAGCGPCHTPTARNGFPNTSMGFAGGLNIALPDGSIVRSTNITPDESTGIGRWSKERFISEFKHRDAVKLSQERLPDGEFNTNMPWAEYSGMTEEDLGAIYDYLSGLTPIHNSVQKFTAAPKE
jgi:mono/diheme cytochrome c family protein